MSELPTPQDASVEEAPARYIVGIDLGTTNSAVAFVDTQRSPWRVENFPVLQLVAPGQLERRDSLPSFHYQPADSEFADGDALRLPWMRQPPDHVVGAFARDHGAQVPSRLIVSAKSWLCHTGVDRTQDLLPWQGAADVARLPPVEVSARYLKHVRAAWDAAHGNHPLAEQDIVVTLPASFDEVARELTVDAASRAGLQRVVLIEEPQAAFYHWIDQHRDDWERLVQPNQKILVCDIGGGTSDFTLILARREGERQPIQFQRVAVGDHLILGGDNLDLALAQHVEAKIAPGGGRLEARQWDMLWRQCRQVKETLLAKSGPESVSISLSQTGRRLIGGSLQCEVTREEVRDLLLDGFFPVVELDDEPGKPQSGFQEFGLPYAPDPAVTRYLAAFLKAHRHGYTPDDVETDAEPAAETAGLDPARPDIVLFNGGVFHSPLIRERVLQAIGNWFRGESGEAWTPLVLDNDRLDLAVARGAAYFGMARRGEGVRIASGLARSYYVGVQRQRDGQFVNSALCLVPAGAEPGEEFELSRDFQLQVASPVEFPLFVSSTRLTDPAGALLDIDLEQLRPLAPIRTVLQTRERGGAAIRVRLHARITEIGTLELWCHERDAGGERSPRRWRLQFDVRSATQTDLDAHQGAAEQAGFFDESLWDACRDVVANTFDEGGDEKPAGLMKRLGAVLGADRSGWAPSLLRRIWELLLDLEAGRRRSPAHEARWLNLLGFSLRPGYGLAVDDWRVAETWRRVQGKLAHGTPECRAESWILWRRIAGGLRAGQQQALADPLMGLVRQLQRRFKSKGVKKGGAIDLSSHEAAEIWRLLGSLEHLPLASKIELGDILADLVPRPKLRPIRSGLLWAIGRVGSRQPVYGLLNDVVPAEVGSRWLETLLGSCENDAADHLAIMLLARRTGDRYRDVDESLRREVLEQLRAHQAAEHVVRLVAEGGQLDAQEQQHVFGEALPHGLRIA